MRFNPKARVDQDQFEDRSGRPGGGLGGGLGGGAMRLPIPGGTGGRVSLGTVVIAIIVFVVTQYAGGSGSNGPADTSTCRTGVDAEKSQKCAVALFTESVQDYWNQALPQQTGNQYQDIKTVVFSGSTDSGCGQAAAAMGPFYCPNDKTVYLDSTFFADMLQGELGAKGGPFSIGYVVAHEYGHHIEDLLGYLGRIKTQRGPKSDSVRIELMADCLGGMWARSAEQTKDENGESIVGGITSDDISRAIDAAQAVGDDRIQKHSSGRVDSEAWTHGSAEQRAHWFNVGLKEGSLQACDTFAPGAL